MLIRKDFAPLRFAGNYCVLQWEKPQRTRRLTGLPRVSLYPLWLRFLLLVKATNFIAIAANPHVAPAAAVAFAVVEK